MKTDSCTKTEASLSFRSLTSECFNRRGMPLLRRSSPCASVFSGTSTQYTPMLLYQQPEHYCKMTHIPRWPEKRNLWRPSLNFVRCPHWHTNLKRSTLQADILTQRIFRFTLSHYRSQVLDLFSSRYLEYFDIASKRCNSVKPISPSLCLLQVGMTTILKKCTIISILVLVRACQVHQPWQQAKLE